MLVAPKGLRFPVNHGFSVVDMIILGHERRWQKQQMPDGMETRGGVTSHVLSSCVFLGRVYNRPPSSLAMDGGEVQVDQRRQLLRRAFYGFLLLADSTVHSYGLRGLLRILSSEDRDPH